MPCSRDQLLCLAVLAIMQASKVGSISKFFGGDLLLNACRYLGKATWPFPLGFLSLCIVNVDSSSQACM